MSLLSFSEVTRFYSRQDVLTDVTISVEPGERIGLVGRNGAGKTTLIRLIMDEEQPDAGQVTRARGLKLGYLPQDILSQAEQSLLNLVLDTDPEYRRVEAELVKAENDLAALDQSQTDELTALAGHHSQLLHQFESLGGWERESSAKKILSGLGFSEADFHRSLSQFSGGWIMRGVLARLLLAQPDLLVLDEPTNHLDLDSLIWLENYLKGSTSALILVSHDRVFLNNVVQKIIELRRGRADTYQGNYEQFLTEKAQRLVSEAAAFANQQDRIKQMEKFIERNRVRASTARRAQSRVKALEKMDRLSPPEGLSEVNFNLQLPRGRRGPDLVAEMISVTKNYGGIEVYRNLNLNLKRGDRLALVGPNGRGKSTLLKLLLGLTAPSSGSCRMGQNVDVGYFAQFQMDGLNPSMTLLEELSSVAGGLSQGSLRSILGSFLFSGEDVFKKISVLSGGEKTRLVLAKIMLNAPNLLLLDEPTNHLDIPGRQMLEEALDNFEGTLVLISHDRHFINRLCDHIGIIEDGSLTVYPGSFDDYQELWSKKFDLTEASQKNPSPLSKGSRDKVDKNTSEERTPDERRKLETETRKKEAARRRPLIKTIEETEKNLEELKEKRLRLEGILAAPETYQDQDQVKTLNQELSKTNEQTAHLEQIWEKTMLELEGNSQE